MSTTGQGPSKKGYWVGAAIVAVGVIGAILWGVLGFLSFADTIDNFQRVPANGEGELSFTKAGGYVIYYEGPGADSGDIPSGQAELTPAGSDDPVPLEMYSTELTYNIGDHSGQAVLTFDIDDPGSYLLESTSEGDGELAVGRSVGDSLVSTVVGAFALGGLGFVVGVIILIVTAVRRRGARPRSAPWIPPPPGSGPAYPPPPGSAYPPPYGTDPPPPPPYPTQAPPAPPYQTGPPPPQ